MVGYSLYLKSHFLPMLLSRTVPVAGITLLFSLVAHTSRSDLAVFSYSLAILTIISALASMSLSAAGNVAATPDGKTSSIQSKFSSGAYLSVALSAVATCVAILLSFLIDLLPGTANLDNEKLRPLSAVYITCIPFVITNTFLHLFHEGSGYAASCTKIKTAATVAGCILLIFIYFIAPPDYFAVTAMGYFPITEIITFVAFTKLSSARDFKFRLNFCAKTAMVILSLGLPIALGLSGQKFYFYLLNERLAYLDTRLLSELAIFTTLTGILLIPFAALSQAHSLYISKTPENRPRSYLFGLGWFAVISTLLLMLGAFFGDALFSLIGGSALAGTPAMLGTLALFLVSNGLLSMTMGHLRGMNDTLRPQLIANLTIFIVLVPLIYWVKPQQLDIRWYLLMQSLTILGIWLLLTLRIILLGRTAKYSALRRTF